MAFRIYGFKDDLGVLCLTETDADVAVRMTAEWIDDGWTNVTMTDESTGHVLGATQIADAFSALQARDQRPPD